MMECDEPEDPVHIVLGKEQDRWLQATVQLKHLVIGSNRQKAAAIENGIVSRLLGWLSEESIPQELRTEAAILLGSLAFGTDTHIQQLVLAGAVPVLLNGLSNPSLNYLEACLRCLRTIFLASCPPVELIYQDPVVIQLMLSIIHQTTCTKETISNILANSCMRKEHQDMLLHMGAIPALSPLLSKGTMYKIQMPILKFFAALCYQNTAACNEVLKASVGNQRVVEMIRNLQSRDMTSEMQMAAAKCLTYLYRGESIEPDQQSEIREEIIHETLHTLIRMCKKDRTLDENVDGAETLAFLIQLEPDLQNMASICDHSLKALAEYLGYTEIQQLDSRQAQKKQVNWENSLKAAAFEAFAAIGANDEEIRKKIIAIDHLTECVVEGMRSDDPKVQMAACRCLHSLSRSVQQIRTTLRDVKAWEPLVKMMKSDDQETLRIASSTVCNMLLDFSPSKEKILECGAMQLLVKLCQNQNDPSLRLNGVWGLMNMAFNADTRVKMQILELLGTDVLFSLLSEHNLEILVRTLGLLRNLLSKRHGLALGAMHIGKLLLFAQSLSNSPPATTSPGQTEHVDNVMAAFGTTALQAVVFILSEKGHPVKIKEQALCVLANISDGVASKMALLDNADVMERLMDSLKTSDEVKLQVAVICVIKNLLSGEDDDAVNRMQHLRDQGVQPHLQRLAQSPDTHVQERAKSALRHFPS